MFPSLRCVREWAARSVLVEKTTLLSSAADHAAKSPSVAYTPTASISAGIRLTLGSAASARTREGTSATIISEDDASGRDRLVEFVDRNRNKGKPFMMYWSPLAVHSPHSNTPEAYCERTSVPKGLPVNKFHGSNRRLLGGGIVALDDQIGKLLEAKHLGRGTVTDVGSTYKLCRRDALLKLLPLLMS